MYWDTVYIEAMSVEPQSTDAIAKKLKCNYWTAWKNLTRLFREKRINGKLINQKTWVWWWKNYTRPP